MQKIKGGEFMMGSQIPESGKDEMPHKVRITKPYFIGKTEVTNAEFCQFLNEKGNQIEGGVTWIDLNGVWDDEKCRIYQKNKSFFVETSYENYPVIYVSWFGATAYCKWLSEKTGKQYRLPTEAEWEFAATNGEKHTKFSWGDGAPIGSVGNVCDETARTKYDSWSAFPDYADGYIYTSPVATYEPNDFGLHDMTGNVWEWCSDWYDKPYYTYSPIENPTGATSGTNRVIRGGSWFNYPKRCRAANRSDNTPDARDGDLGFRVALSPE
jgi:formylglycine-generating enzyme required for sulfatase activity